MSVRRGKSLVSDEEIEERKLAIYIDYESIKENFSSNLIKRILETSREFGRVIKAKIYFHQDQFSENKDSIEDVLKMGIEPVVVTLAKDVKMAIDVLDDSYSEDIDLILLVYNREALLPALIDIKNRKPVYLFKVGELPESIINISDQIIEIE